MKNKVQNARSNSQIHLMRSMFVKIAPICDVLPNDVMVKIIKYIYSDKNWSYFPLISKSFKNIMYSNGITLYNDYTIVTRDDAMLCTLDNGNDILKLHISHSQHLGKIQFCPLLTLESEYIVPKDNDEQKYSDHDDGEARVN